jgi:primosomal protein N'
MLEFKGKNLDQIKIKSQELARLILEFWKTQSLDPSKAILVGPHPAPVERINDFFRIQMCVSFLKTLHPQQILGPVLSLWKSSHHVGLRVDVDPHSFQ